MINSKIKLLYIILMAIAIFTNCQEKDINSHLEYWNKEISKNPNDRFLYEDRGSVYAKFGMYDKAIEDFKKSLSIKESTSAYYNLAKVYLNTYCIKDSLETIKKTIKMDPDYASYHAIHGLCNDLLGKKPDIIIPDYTKYIDTRYRKTFKNKYYIIYLRRSIQYLRKGDVDNAQKDFDFLLKIDDDSNEDDLYYMQFMLYAKSGKEKEALEYLKKALKEGFNDEDAIKAFLDSEKSINKAEAEKIIAKYFDKDEPLNGFDFDKQKFIIDKYFYVEERRQKGLLK